MYSVTSFFTTFLTIYPTQQLGVPSRFNTISRSDVRPIHRRLVNSANFGDTILNQPLGAAYPVHQAIPVGRTKCGRWRAGPGGFRDTILN